MLVELVYWLHWALDILFFAACLQVIFQPKLWARIYITLFLAQQLILNGCIMTWLQNVALMAAHQPLHQNMFIMDELFSGQIVTVYKVLFAVVAIIQIFYIVKELACIKNKMVSAQQV